MISALWIFIICVEIFRNWCIIEVSNKRPTYWWSNVIRIAIGFIFWVVVKLFSDINHWQWWGMIPMMLFSFWWIFDYGLSAFRNLMNRIMNKAIAKIPFCYLNPNGSFLDQFQCKYPGELPWFWFKFVFMIAGFIVFKQGINSVWESQWSTYMLAW